MLHRLRCASFGPPQRTISTFPRADPKRFQEKITGYLQQPDGPDITIRHLQSLASGLAAVWATENTREGLFDAMQRKEVYATTGTRMTVRLFAGWDFVEVDVQRPDFADDGYRRGVPMGGDGPRFRLFFPLFPPLFPLLNPGNFRHPLKAKAADRAAQYGFRRFLAVIQPTPSSNGVQGVAVALDLVRDK